MLHTSHKYKVNTFKLLLNLADFLFSLTTITQISTELEGHQSADGHKAEATTLDNKIILEDTEGGRHIKSEKAATLQYESTALLIKVVHVNKQVLLYYTIVQYISGFLLLKH